MTVLGKARRDLLRRVVYRKLGARSSEVLVGPEFGVDNAVVKCGTENVLVLTTDPLSLIPAIGPEESAWLSIHLLASDLTTSGFPPQLGVFDLNLPLGMTNSTLSRYWASLHRECRNLGIAIVGGHTGRYEGCGYTIIGGGVLTAFGPADRYLVSSMAGPGDDVILTKGVAIETTAILTRSFAKMVRKALGPRLFERASSYIRRVSTVDDSLTAISVGVHDRGVTAMHDATEGGVVAGLWEIAAASKLGIHVDMDEVEASPETIEVCKLFRIDPLISLSEGTLILTCRPSKTGKVLDELSSKRIDAWVVGRMTSKFQGCRGPTSKGSRRTRYPQVDPYWAAYARAAARGWS